METMGSLDMGKWCWSVPDHDVVGGSGAGGGGGGGVVLTGEENFGTVDLGVVYKR